MTATGLNLIGRIGHSMITLGARKESWKDCADKLGKLDWSRQSDLWNGNIVQGNRILTMQVPLKLAYEKVAALINLSPQSEISGEAMTVVKSETPKPPTNTDGETV